MSNEQLYEKYLELREIVKRKIRAMEKYDPFLEQSNYTEQMMQLNQEVMNKGYVCGTKI